MHKPPLPPPKKGEKLASIGIVETTLMLQYCGSSRVKEEQLLHHLVAGAYLQFL